VLLDQIRLPLGVQHAQLPDLRAVIDRIGRKVLLKLNRIKL
jgi:hypothetical protein